MPTRTFALAGLTAIVACSIFLSLARGQSELPTKVPGAEMSQAEDLAKKHMDAFRQSGVPTPKAVKAAFKQAESAKTIESWQTAARLANSYANVVDVLSDHYRAFSEPSGGRDVERDSLYRTLIGYKFKREEFLAMRNRVVGQFESIKETSSSSVQR